MEIQGLNSAVEDAGDSKLEGEKPTFKCDKKLALGLRLKIDKFYLYEIKKIKKEIVNLLPSMK